MPLLYAPSHVIVDTTLAAAAQNLDVANLDHNNDGPWHLWLTIVNDEGSTADINLYFNGDYTATNYQSHFLRGAGTTRFSNRLNRPGIESLIAGASSIIIGAIMIDAAGYARYVGHNSRKLTTAIDNIGYVTATDSTVSNITSLRIGASISDGLGAGTRLILSRLAH